MDHKIQRALYCLYLVMVAQVLMMVHSVITVMGAPHVFEDGQVNFSVFPLIASALFYPLLVMLATSKTQRLLKQRTGTGWVCAVGVFLFAIPTYAFPVALFGLLNLFDVEVRGTYLKELDIKL